MNTKRNTLVIGIIALIIPILLWILEVRFGLSCRYVNGNGHTIKYCGVITLSLLPIISLIPFSVILYFLRDEVFHAWWRFARWWVPVIVAVTLFVQNAGGGGGWGMNGGAFDAFFIGIFYAIFIIVSLVKIFNAYFKTRIKR